MFYALLFSCEKASEVLAELENKQEKRKAQKPEFEFTERNRNEMISLKYSNN